MIWHINAYQLALFISAITALIVAILIWPRRSAPGGLPLFLMLITTMIWAGANAFFLNAETIQSRYFWSNVGILGVLCGTPTLLIFALQYTGREHWLTRRNLILISFIPFASIFLAWTNHFHHLFYTEVDSGTPRVMGIGFYVFLVYSYPLVIYTLAVIIQAYIRSPQLYRGQTGAILIGTLIPFVGNVIHQGLNISLEDPTPILFTIMGLFYAYGLFAFRLFDLVPVARHTLVEHMRDGVLVIDSRNRIIDVNPAAFRLLRFTARPLIGLNINQLAFSIPIDETSQTEIMLEGESPRHLSLQAEPLLDRHNIARGHLIVVRDITERKRLEVELERLATADPLTGILNRRQLIHLVEIELERARRYGHPTSAILLDVDYFKEINDTFGHTVGDKVLVEMAQLLIEKARTSDLVARYGGEEFMLILPETTIAGAQDIAERIRSTVAETSFIVEGQTIRFTVSLGVTSSESAGDDFESLLKESDRMLYRAKQLGRNRVVSYN